MEAALKVCQKGEVWWSRVTSSFVGHTSQELELSEQHDSWRLVWLLPGLVVVNIALLIAGHFCLYLHVHSTIQCSLRDIPDRTISPLNFIGTISRSMHAHAYLMALTVTVWVVAWPYVKVIATMATASWTRSKQITKDKAVMVLERMNVVAKWSFVEVFFFCFAAMATSMQTPTHEINVKLAHAGHLDIRAKAGTFSFASNIQLLPGAMAMIAAIMVATALTHWVVHELEPPSKALIAAKRDERDHLPALMAAIAALLFLLLGLDQSMMTFDRQGFLGKALGKRSKVDMSVHSMISMLREEPSLADQPAVQVLRVIAVFLALVAPTLEMMFLIASLHWAKVDVGLSRQMRRVAEWLYSFDCIEVLLFNCLVALCDFSNFMAYVVKDECERMEGFITYRELDKLGLLYLYDTSCIKIRSRLGLGFWLFLMVVVLRSVAWRQAPKHQAQGSSEQPVETIANA